MKVKDLMKTEVLSVGPDEKIGKVAKILFDNRFHALPVVENGKLIGIITENDFFIKDSSNLFLPSYLDFLEKSKNINDLPEEKKENVKKLLDAKASDIMTKDCITLSPEDDILEIIKFYRKTGFNSFPVIDLEKKMVGIATCADVMGLIT